MGADVAVPILPHLGVSHTPIGVAFLLAVGCGTCTKSIRRFPPAGEYQALPDIRMHVTHRLRCVWSRNMGNITYLEHQPRSFISLSVGKIILVGRALSVLFMAPASSTEKRDCKLGRSNAGVRVVDLCRR
jgi:hypothetical protein